MMVQTNSALSPEYPHSSSFHIFPNYPSWTSTYWILQSIFQVHLYYFQPIFSFSLLYPFPFPNYYYTFLSICSRLYDHRSAWYILFSRPIAQGVYFFIRKRSSRFRPCFLGYGKLDSCGVTVLEIHFTALDVGTVAMNILHLVSFIVKLYSKYAWKQGLNQKGAYKRR